MLITLKTNILIKSSGFIMEAREVYKALVEMFPDEEPMLIQRVLNGNSYCWNIPVAVGEVWKQLGMASQAESKAVLEAIYNYRQKINKKFQFAEDVLDAIFSTPNDNTFVFFNLKNDKMRVAIAAWGFQYKSGNIEHDDASVRIYDGITKLRRSIKIGFKANEKLLPGIDFILEVQSGASKKFTTPQSGLCELGDFKVGLNLGIYVPCADFRCDFTIIQNLDIYVFDLSKVNKSNSDTEESDSSVKKEKSSQEDQPPKDNSESSKVTWNPTKPHKKTGNPVINAPLPFVPDPKKVVYDPVRKHKIYDGCIFVIIDLAKSQSKDPVHDFCNQFLSLYPASKIISCDSFCNMITIALESLEQNRILDELHYRIRNVEFYADVVGVLVEANSFETSSSPETWHMDVVGAKAAQCKTKGSKEVKVAIIDTYFDLEHYAFRHMRVESALSLEDGTDNVAPPDLSDESSHGTHVLGLIGAQDSNYCGMAPECTFIPISVGKSANTVSLLQAVLYALNKGASVINVSMGFSIPPEEAAKLTINDQVKWWMNHAKGYESVWDYVYGMLDRGYCTIVWAAGNDNLFELMDSTKRHDSIIRVDAVDVDLRKTNFSNFGNIDQKIDNDVVKLRKSVISAPGQYIYSTVPGNEWKYKSGTSMSAPIVAGAVALIKSLDSTLTNREIIEIISDSSLSLVDPSIGPLLRIDRALELVSGKLSQWDEFALNPTLGLGLWKKIDQTSYVDTNTHEFKYYGHNYLMFDSHDNGVIEVHVVGQDCVYNARFTALWKIDEVILDIIPPFKSTITDNVILTSQIRIYRDSNNNVAFEVLKPSHASHSHLRRLDKDDRINKNKRKF